MSWILTFFTFGCFGLSEDAGWYLWSMVRVTHPESPLTRMPLPLSMKSVVVSVLCIVACNEIHAFIPCPLCVNNVRSTLRQTYMNNFLRANGILKLKATNDNKGDLPSNDLPIDSEPYDGGSGDNVYKPYDRYKSPEVIDPNFLNGKSLFDIGTPKQRRAAMDPIRQSEVRNHHKINNCFRILFPDYD